MKFTTLSLAFVLRMCCGAPPAEPYKPCPTDGSACKILSLGDSITAAGGNGSYRVGLFQHALDNGYAITFVGSWSAGPATVGGVPFPPQHEGTNGAEIADLIARVPEPAFEDGVPDVVMLLAGTNDVGRKDDLANAPARMGLLIDKLAANAPDALILVAQLIPLPQNEPGVSDYNAALPAVVEDRAAAGVHVELVDLHTGFPVDGLSDGVHPNDLGYAFMADVWYAALAPHL